MKDSETTTAASSPTTTCPSERVMLDLCRTGGCCPKAIVTKDVVDILVPASEMRITDDVGDERHVVVQLTKDQIDRIAVEMRRRT